MLSMLSWMELRKPRIKWLHYRLQRIDNGRFSVGRNEQRPSGGILQRESEKTYNLKKLKTKFKMYGINEPLELNGLDDVD